MGAEVGAVADVMAERTVVSVAAVRRAAETQIALLGVLGSFAGTALDRHAAVFAAQCVGDLCYALGCGRCVALADGDFAWEED